MANINGTEIPVSFRPNSLAYNSVLVTFVILLIFIVIVGNFLVIATFLKTDSLRRPTYYILSSLAFVDFLTGAIALPLETYRRVVLTETTCIYYTMYMTLVTFTISAGSLCHFFLVTLDRYIAVHKPLRYETLVTPKRIAIAIAVGWAILVGQFVILTLIFQEIPTTISSYCAETNNWTYLIVRIIILLEITVFLLLQITLIILNASILRTALQHARRIAQMEQAVGGRNASSSRVKAAKTDDYYHFVFCLLHAFKYFFIYYRDRH